MSKKPDTASALAGILKAKRSDLGEGETGMATPLPAAPESHVSPSPALLLAATTEKPEAAPGKRRGGKSSDKANYSQCSVYLRKDTRKKVNRALDDAETGQDFSDLVQELLEKWLTSRT